MGMSRRGCMSRRFIIGRWRGGNFRGRRCESRIEWEGQLEALRRGDVSAVKAFRFVVVRAGDPALALPVVFEDWTVRVYRVP